MNDPYLYDKCSLAQRQDASKFIPYFISLINRKEEETVLDFGCGSGFVTKHILLPALSSPCATLSGSLPTVKLYAVDISEKMIEFASETYADPEITYIAADILKEDNIFQHKFDKIFSSHVLQRIYDQKKICERLYNLLKPNGEICLYFFASVKLFSIFEVMKKIPTWEKYLKDWAEIIPKSSFSLDPAKDMADLMTSIGFQIQESSVQERIISFDNIEQLLDATMAVNPFLHRIPNELQKLYREDFAKTFIMIERNNKLPEACQSGPIEGKYSLALIRALKPFDTKTQ